MTTASTTSAELKQLGFVPKTAEAGIKYAESWVSYTNEHLPQSVKPTVEKLETTVASTVAPVLTAVADRSEKLLRTVDGQVDAAVKTASNVIDNQKAFHTQNLEHYKAAREAYLKKIEELVEFLKEKGLAGSAQYLLDGVKAQLSKVKAVPAYMAEQAAAALAKLQEMAAKLLENEQVTKMVEKTLPVAKAAWGKYMTVHDVVVGNGTYKAAYEKSVGLLGYAQSTGVYRFASNRLYPIVAPYADPALDAVVQSGYYAAVLDHVKPVTK